MKLFAITSFCVLLTSCIMIEKKDYIYAGENPELSIREVIFVNDFREMTDSGVENVSFPSNELFTFDQQSNKIMKIIFQECIHIPDAFLGRLKNNIFPVITLGFYPHKNRYNCPVVIEVKEHNEIFSNHIYNIDVQTIAATSLLFKKNAPISKQLRDERINALKFLIRTNMNEIFRRDIDSVR